MVSAEFCIPKLHNTKARSYFYTERLRKILCFITFLSLFSLYPKVSAVEWQEPQTTSAWKGLWGINGDNRIYLGMWTNHLLPGSNKRLSNTTRLIGFNYWGVFGATFLNSHRDPSFTAGIQRIVYMQKFDGYFYIDAGYRLGLIWGYKTNSPIASLKTSIPNIQNMDPIPFAQIIMDVSWEIVGIQFSYCWTILSAGFFVNI